MFKNNDIEIKCSRLTISRSNAPILEYSGPRKGIYKVDVIKNKSFNPEKPGIDSCFDIIRFCRVVFYLFLKHILLRLSLIIQKLGSVQF